MAEIGLGCWGLGGNAYGPVRDEESARTLERAHELGVNFFDTADVYGFGHSEELVGKTLGRKKNISIATKVGLDFYQGKITRRWDAEYLRFAVGKSLERLRRDAIDLYQLHNPPIEEIEKGEIFETLEGLRRDGKIRHYGISIHVAREGIAAIEKAPGLASVQTIVNMMDQRSAAELFPLAKKKNVAVIAREPLNCGLLGGKITAETKFPKDDHRARWPKEKIELDLKKLAALSAAWDGKKINLPQAAIEFVLGYDYGEVAVVIPGAKTPAQLESNLAAADYHNLTPAAIQKLRALYAADPLFSTGFYRN